MLTPELIRTALKEVKDPEIPTISVVDLGIVTDIAVDAEENVAVTLTPTFAGCPALKMMEDLVQQRIIQMMPKGTIQVKTTFDVPWNSNMISEEGLVALKKHGLAPPPRHEGFIELDVLSDTPCPYCESLNTTMQTPFGPTLCRSMHYCRNCHQAFEAFKPVS